MPEGFIDWYTVACICSEKDSDRTVSSFYTAKPEREAVVLEIYYRSVRCYEQLCYDLHNVVAHCLQVLTCQNVGRLTNFTITLKKNKSINQ